MDYKTREEVPEKYKWDLSKRYKTVEEWQKSTNEIKNKIEDFKKYRNHIFDSSEKLYEALEAKAELSKETIRNY